MADDPNLLTRRSVLKRAAALFGGSVTATQLSLLMRSVAAMAEDTTPRFLNQEQFSMIERIVDLIIPETDTPRRTGRRCSSFYRPDVGRLGIAAKAGALCRGPGGYRPARAESGADSFSASSTAQQTVLLQTLDKETFAQDAIDTFFGEFKKMVLFAYYSSETGATIELRYQRIPGDYRPCVPLDEIGRAWFWNGYSYDL